MVLCFKPQTRKLKNKILNMSVFEKQLELSSDPNVLAIVRRLNNFDTVCFKHCIGTPEKRLYDEDEKCLSKI